MLLIPNLIEACLLFVLGVILLLVQPIRDPGANYYRRAKRWMSFAFFVGGMSILIGLVFERFRGEQIEILNIYSLISFYLGSVAMLLSFVCLYNIKELTLKTLAWIFAPVAVLISIYAIGSLWWPSPVIYSLEEVADQLCDSPLLMLRVLILLGVIVSIIVTAYRYFQARRAYRAMLRDYFSGDEELLRSGWIDRLFFWLFLSIPTAIGAYLISSVWYDLFYGLVLAGGTVFFTVRMINYQQLFLRIAPAVEFAQLPPASGEQTTDSIARIFIDQWLNRPEKPYLAPGLTIADVARGTGLSKRRLSMYINSVMGKNFNGWINQLRVREAERQLLDKTNTRTLSEIAYLTGFTDLAAMSNAFKKVTGVAPSVYRRRATAEINKQ